MLTPSEVGGLVRVDATTVSRWCQTGALLAVRTPGGHRRIPVAAVLALLATMGMSEAEAATAVRSLA